MKTKYKEAGNGLFIRITEDENGKINKSPSFSAHEKPRTFGHALHTEMIKWKAAGGKVEKQFTSAELTQNAAVEEEKEKTAYIGLKRSEYPDPIEYNDSLVKMQSSDESLQAEGLSQQEKYFADCLAVKEKYPKPF